MEAQCFSVKSFQAINLHNSSALKSHQGAVKVIFIEVETVVMLPVLAGSAKNAISKARIWMKKTDSPARVLACLSAGGVVVKAASK